MTETQKPDFRKMQVYQVWPRSFKDSNGDGIGDLGGILEKLSYIKALGTDLLWLSPVYVSGNRDYGYDIDDYYSINPEYGSMADIEKLISEAKKLDMGILMDLVANHTSDRHEWFQKALESPDSPYRDYYYFRKGSLDSKGNRKAPNNWLSAFGGSAWQYHTESDSWYLTIFTPNQCDLNWENPEVREGIHKIMHFWLKKGIAGFRMDVINTIAKTEGLPNAGQNHDKLDFPFEHIVSLDKSHDYLKEIHEKVLIHYPHCITVGEGMVCTPKSLNLYTKPERKELDMMFHFDVVLLGCGSLGKFDFRKFYRWKPLDLKRIIFAWMHETEAGGGWIGNFMSNHDWPRQVSRFGNDKVYRSESAKAIALLNFTLRGTPYIYQGEEIGMTSMKLKKTEWRDFEAFNALEALKSMLHLPGFLAELVIQTMTRDNSRTPMQWNKSKNAAFTEGQSWIKINPNYTSINVEIDSQNPQSILFFYQELSQIRKSRPELYKGSFIPLLENHPTIFAYLRQEAEHRSLILINWSSREQNLTEIPELKRQYPKNDGLPLLTNRDKIPWQNQKKLAAWEACIYDFDLI